MKNRIEPKGWRRAGLAAALVFGLAGCESLMEVNLPSQLSDEALQDPAGATTQINTIIAQFEDAWDFQVYRAFGREEGGEVYLCGPMCDVSEYITANPHFVQMAKSLRFGRELWGKLDKEWTVAQVPLRSRYLAISSLYQGAVLGWAGTTLCEVTIDGGKLQAPGAILDQADVMLTRALTEIAANPGGDFAVPYGIATSAKQMAYGLRAQVRWFKGDLQAAKADAEQVQQGFVAWNTREAGNRLNKGWTSGSGGGFQEVYDPVDWWKGPNNPVTNQPWPAVIPFTGYTYLGIAPDGRAISDGGNPIRTRGNPPPFGATPGSLVGVTTGAVLDTRVKHTTLGVIQGKQAGGEVASKYDQEGSDEPLVNWKEMVLIRAEAVGGQGAIDLVNTLRDFDKLPRVTYAAAGNAQQIRYMILEEKRRVLYNEGRFFYTKLRNMDVLWFPRNVGATRARQRPWKGGIRYTMPVNEYVANENLRTSDLATQCAPNERPINPL